MLASSEASCQPRLAHFRTGLKRGFLLKSWGQYITMIEGADHWTDVQLILLILINKKFDLIKSSSRICLTGSFVHFFNLLHSVVRGGGILLSFSSYCSFDFIVLLVGVCF